MSQRRGRTGYRGAGGGPPAQGANAGARGALLLAVAVILGIVLLQQFDTDIDTGGQVSTATTGPSAETTTTRRVGLTTVPVQTSTTARARPKGEVRVLVANGSGQRGLAGATTTELKKLGYDTLAATDATTNIERTIVQFVEGWETEAREVAASLTLPATVVSRLASPPVAAADISDAKVIVVLGQAEATSSTTSAPGASSTTSTTRR